MGKKKSSHAKRSKEESTQMKKDEVKNKKPGKKNLLSGNEDNTNQGGNQSFCEDQKLSKNIICEKDSNKYALKPDKAHNVNTTDLLKDKEYKSLSNDKEEEWSTVQNRSKKKPSPESLSEEQKYHKNDQKQSKLFDSNSKQKNAHDNKIIDLHEDKDTCKSVTKVGKRSRDEIKNQNSQKQSETSYNDSNGDNSKQRKAYDRKTIDSHKDTSKSKEKERPGNENKNKNSQKQSKYKGSNGDNSKQRKSYDGKNIDSYDDTRKSQEEESFIHEIDEDIFNLSNDYSLAHCVAEDLRMGAGIAVDFKRIFGGVGKLIDQKLIIGDVGIVKRHDQYAFYLVTKKTSNGKPTMTTMEKALLSLLSKMKEYNLTKLGIPKIGCGLDKLDWSDTKLLIKQIFSRSGIHITVCVPSKLIDSKTTPRLKVFITPTNLWEMQAETIFILFIDLERICNKNWIDHIVDKVDAKYPFKEKLLRDVKYEKFKPGDIRRYDVKKEVIICIFTTQSTYYGSLENGFKTINKIKKYKYLAIQSDPIDYPSDNFLHISWVVLISRSVFQFSELWLCGVKQTNGQVYYDEYCKNAQYPMNN